MSELLLSLCIPTYNKGRQIYSRVMEYLMMPYEWLEVAVTDDGSNDDTYELLTSISDVRFKYFKNKTNLGYGNLAESLKNGSGKFCLLIADSDKVELSDADAIYKLLKEDDETSLFQFEFQNEKGQLLYPIDTRQHEAGDYSAFERVLSTCAYSGGYIVKHSTLEEIWEGMIREKPLWNLYSQMIIALYAVKYGDLCHLSSVVVTREARQYDIAKANTKALSGGEDEPYWTIKSRITQNMAWLSFFSKFDIDDSLRIRLAERTVCEAIKSVKAYYYIVNDLYQLPFFRMHEELIARDRKAYRNRWISEAHSVYRIIDRKFKELFSGYNHFEYMGRVVNVFGRVYLFFLKEKIKSFGKNADLSEGGNTI